MQHSGSSTTDSARPGGARPTSVLVAFPCTLNWKTGVPAIREISCPTSAVCDGKTAYFRKYQSRETFSFNCHTKSWKELPPCRVKDTTLVLLPVVVCGVFVSILHTIGGIKRKEDRQDEDDLYTDALYQLSQDEGKWTESSIYPKMLSKRSQVTAVYHKNILVTAGGRGDTGTTATVEILHSTDRNWYRVTDLPRKQYKASGCVCDGKLYILGGCEMGDEGPRSIKSVYEVDFMSLEQACTASHSKEIRYNKIASLPLRNSTCVSFFGFILAIGGSDNNRGWVSSRKIHAYHSPSDTWQHLPDSSLLEKRCFCFSVVVDKGDKLEVIVVGGYKTRPDVDCTNSVEIAEIKDTELSATQLQELNVQRIDRLWTDNEAINICYLKVLLVGPPGVGKTTTLNRLLKKYENICTAGDNAKHQSTLLANCTQVLALVSQDKADWLSSSSEDMDKEAILFIQYLCGVKLKKLDEIVHSSEPKEESGLTQSEPELDQQTNMHGSQTHESPPNQSQAEEFSVPETPVSTKKLEQIKERLRKLVRSGNYTKAINHLGNTLLNINDVGGQPAFLEMLPALSTGPAMYLVFFDLSKELNQLYEVSFDRGNTVITPFKSLHSVESTISQILSSIASAHGTSRKSASVDIQKMAHFEEKFRSFQEIQPVATLIGTHLDELKDPSQKIKETSERLEIVTGKFDEIVITLPQTVTSSPFFSVNNYDGEAAEDIAPIRNFMNEIFHTRFQKAFLRVRKNWLILNIVLRIEYCIVELKDCFEIGEVLGIDRGEVKFCLWYFDCIGTLMYYPNIANDEDDWFKNHVICSPQVIFDSISQLIIFSMSKIQKGGTVTKHEQNELIKKGQFSLKLIEMLCKNEHVAEKLQKKKLIPARQLIKLLKYVNLLSPIIHKEADGERITYLMPAVLDCATLDELTTPSPPNTDNPEPLLITFKCGFIPTGTFCGLITQLVSHGPNGILDFVWDLVEDGVKRNLVSFYVDFVNKVTLICHDRCYEVRVHSTSDDPDISLHTLCAHVLSVVLHILRDLYEKLTPVLAFRCPCTKHKDKRTLSNLCTLEDRDNKRLRFLCDKRPVKLEQNQSVWIGEHVSQFFSSLTKCTLFMDSNKTPHQSAKQGVLNLKEVKKVTYQARSKWFHLGIELDIDIDKLKTIQKDKNYVADDCLTEMLSHWLKSSSPPPSWSSLKEALSSPVIGHEDIAKEITADIKTDTAAANKCVYTLKSVRRLLWNARSKWRSIGLELEVDDDMLNAIEMTYHSVVDDCFTEVLLNSHWLKPLTLENTKLLVEKLMEVLRSRAVDREDIAKNVEANWGKQN